MQQASISSNSVSLVRSLAQSPTHPWLYHSEQVFSDHQLLRECVVLLGVEGDAEEAHDAGVAREPQGYAVLPQEALQLGGGLGHHFQGHGGACQDRHKTSTSHFHS